MSFSSTLLHARKSRANSEISELLTARRMDITVWMSSPNDEVPAVAEAGSDTGGSRRTASPTVPGGPRWQRGLWFTHGLEEGRGGSRGAFGHPYSWPYAAGDNSRRRVSPDSRVRALSGPMWDQTFHAARVRMTVGGRVAVQLAAVALPWTSFRAGLYSDTREATHHVQIIEYILGFLGPGKDGEN
ncbi:hypothetical protein EVAR_26932_1 [Eumeta japonica]|uniref:Uncharacterized protein n=1 Tax=Eumeta variegata TaxID=151549 RepID=A0A4C1VTH6_EUMVA|nr:hypothetical protein EVAR_26932_1 [Eumeta japonica]